MGSKRPHIRGRVEEGSVPDRTTPAARECGVLDGQEKKELLPSVYKTDIQATLAKQAEGERLPPTLKGGKGR